MGGSTQTSRFTALNQGGCLVLILICKISRELRKDSPISEAVFWPTLAHFSFRPISHKQNLELLLCCLPTRVYKVSTSTRIVVYTKKSLLTSTARTIPTNSMSD